MATQYSNKPIVTDGLVYALDFGNPKSYVSGSSTARSLIYRPAPAKFETLLPGDIAQPAAAYSVRKVVSSYTGDAMMVQSASVSQSIGFDADGNLDTASLASFAGSGDAFVKIWYDQSGNNNHATQSNASLQPKVYSGSQGSVILENGRPALDFPNSKKLTLLNQLYSGQSGFSYYFTTRCNVSTTSQNSNILFSLSDVSQGTGNLFRINVESAGVIIRVGGSATWSYAEGPTDYSLFSFDSFDGTNLNTISAFQNSTQMSGGGATTLNIDPGVTEIGSWQSGYYDGIIQEVVLYTSSQATNRTRIETNINRYYQIYPSSYDPIPDPDNAFLDFTDESVLQTQQSFPGFSYDQGNSTVMYVGETKGDSTVFTQDGALSIVSTTSSVGFGSPENLFGRSYPASGLKHVTLRFSSGSTDCFINGVPVSASAVLPSGSSIGGGQLNIPLYTGSLGGFQVYNRPLTSDEIYNNYLIAARRYESPELPAVAKPYTLDENAYLFLQSAGITDPIITSSIDTFVRGLKSNNLWDKMIAIYPFVGTGSEGINLTGSQLWNLKEPSLVTYPLSFTGSWIGSTSGSAPSGSNTNISVNGITPSQYYPFFNTQSAHISILSYDTPVSSSYLMGTGMTEDLAVSTLAGDYGTPAAAYSVRKVRTAYSGALMDVRRSLDNVTSSIGYVSNGDLDTGSLLDWVVPGRNNLPGEYEGLAAAYSLRKVSASYDGFAVEVRRDWDNESGSFGFDINGELDTVSLLTFVTGSAGTGSGFVQTWYDQSGNNNHATQTATGSQPLIVSSGSLVTENGKPAFYWNSNGTFDITPFDLTDNYTLFLLNGPNSAASRQVYLEFNSDTYSNTVSLRTNTGAELQAIINQGPNLTLNFPKAPDGNQLLQYFTAESGVSASFGYNNTNTTSSAIGTFGNEGTPYAYKINSARNLTAIANSTYQELIVFTSSQAANRPLIENNINSYYNIYTGSNHGFVARWYDQSGNNHHFQQPLTASQPIIVSSGSYLESVNLDGIDDWMSSATAYTTSNQNSIFAVFKPLTLAGNNQPLLTYNQTDSGIQRSDSIGYYWQPIRNSEGLRSLSFPGGFSVYSFHRTGNGTAAQVLQAYTNTIGNGVPFGYGNLNTGNSPALTHLGRSTAFDNNYNVKEIVIYTTNQTSNRQAIEYNINNYYNIYPQTSSFTTSSFTIKADPTSISGSINNKLTSGIASSGPLGLITVSRTGSNSLTIARNGVTSLFDVPASGALSTGIYLGAINNNGIALGNSPLSISFASVGTGLTEAEINTYKNLVNTLQTNLGRVDLDTLSFFSRVINAGGSLSIIEQSAVNTLVIDLKAYGIWDRMKAIYPMIGGGASDPVKAAAACAQNLKSSNFTGVFNGGWTFASTGVTPNGTTGFFDTFFIPSVEFTSPNASFGIYSRTSGSQLKEDFGRYINNNSAIIAYISYNSEIIPWVGGNGFIRGNYGTKNGAGLYNFQRINSTTLNVFENTVKVVNATQTFTGWPNQSLPFGAYFVSSGFWGSAVRENAFAFIGDSLTDTEAANFYTAVQRFQTTLGRQV